MLYAKLTANFSEDVSSPKIQAIVQELLQFVQQNSAGVSLSKPYIDVLIDTYSIDYVKCRTDTKYGKGLLITL